MRGRVFIGLAGGAKRPAIRHIARRLSKSFRSRKDLLLPRGTPDRTPPMNSSAAVFGVLFGTLAFGALAIFTLVAVVMALVKKTRGWVVTAVALTILVGGAAVVGGVVGFKKASEELGKPRTLTSKDGTTSLQLPPGFIETPGLSTVASIQAAAPLLQAFAMVISESKEGQQIDLAAYNSAILKQMKGIATQASLGNSTNTTINGMPAMQTRLAGKVQGVDLVYLVTTYDGGPSVHQVLAWTSPANETRVWPTLQKVAQGFVVNSGAKAESGSASAPAGR